MLPLCKVLTKPSDCFYTFKDLSEARPGMMSLAMRTTTKGLTEKKGFWSLVTLEV